MIEACGNTSTYLRSAVRWPAGPWPWTDDTEMACSIVGELRDQTGSTRTGAPRSPNAAYTGAAGIPADWLARREPLPGYARR